MFEGQIKSLKTAVIWDYALYYRTPTGVIDHETCTDNFLSAKTCQQFVLRMRITLVILTHCSLNILIIS